MGDQVEHPGHRCTATHGQHHVAQLGDSAVGQAFFQIHLRQGDRGTQETGQRSDYSDEYTDTGELAVKRFQSGNQEHTGSHHRGGMNQR